MLELLSRNKKLYNVILQNYPCLLASRSCSVDNALDKMKNEPTDRVPVTFNMKLKKEAKPQVNINNETKLEKSRSPPVHQVIIFFCILLNYFKMLHFSGVFTRK